jgi:transcriptional regulator with XRE-family HTH domain
MRRVAKISDAFAVVVKQHRLAKQLTHEALAEKAGLHPTYISLVERFLRTPRLDVAESLAKALNLSLGALVGEAEAMLKARKRGLKRS